MNNGMGMQGNYMMNGGMPMQEFIPRPRQNQTNMNQENKGKGNQKPVRITMQPQDFESVIDSKVTTTAKLAKTVSTIMKTTFVDFEGCIILPDNSGKLSVALYFKDKQDDSTEKVKALQPVVGRRSNTSAYQRITNWNVRTRDKIYDLSQTAKEILSEFIPKARNGKINWSNIMCEQTQYEYNMQTIYVQIFGLDINRLVKKIYGNKIKKGEVIERYEYNVTPLKPIVTGINPTINIPKDFIIKIERLNTREVEEIAKMVGTIPMSGAIPMIR